MATATIQGYAIERGTVTLPSVGVWHADVRVASGDTISGAVSLDFAGLSLSGTVVSGGTHRERGWYRVVGGAGGWRRTIRARAYRTEAGVKRSTVLRDLGADAGETIEQPATEKRLGPAFARLEGEAARALDVLAPDGWYVGEDGTTRIGARSASTFGLPYTTIDRVPDMALVTVAAESIVGLVPGATVEGVAAASVRHELTPSAIRSHVHGALVSATDRAIAALVAIVRAVTRRYAYHAHYEYRVITTAGGYSDLRPVKADRGLPDLANVIMRSGMPGGAGDPQTGASVLVCFVDGDPTRPAVVSYEGEAGAGYLPASAAIDASGALALGHDVATTVPESIGRFVRYGDPIVFSAPGPGTVTLPLAGTISSVRGG